MVSSISIARDAIQSASDRTDDGSIHEQLQSIDEALEHLSGEETLDDETEEGERLEQIEEQLVKLGNHTDGAVHQHLEVARDSLDRYRQTDAKNWEN
jgi:hypothetical protein